MCELASPLEGEIERGLMYFYFNFRAAGSVILSSVRSDLQRGRVETQIAVNWPQITKKKDRRDKRKQELMSLLSILSVNRHERQVGHKNTREPPLVLK